MFLLVFLHISSSCLSFWIFFSLLQKQSGVFLFWLSLLWMVFVFCSCLELVWLSWVFSAAAFFKRNRFLFLERFPMIFIILYLDFSCSCRNSILSCSREIILSVLLLGEWDVVLCLSEVRNSFLNKSISIKKIILYVAS